MFGGSMSLRSHSMQLNALILGIHKVGSGRVGCVRGPAQDGFRWRRQHLRDCMRVDVATATAQSVSLPILFYM